MFWKKKGFTLIEMIVVLLILAIVTTIAVPIILKVKNNAKYNTYKRSIDSYGKSLEVALGNYLIDYGAFPEDLQSLRNNYNGYNVNCNIMQIKENGSIYLSECYVDNKLIQDFDSDDGYYHYGVRDLEDFEYVNLYGKSLEKSIKEYYKQNNYYPDNYNLLNVSYRGKKVECSVLIKNNGKVYLTDCSVNNKKVLDANNEDGYYHYGRDYTDKEIVDMYGKSLDNGLKLYHQTNHSYPNDYTEININYNGKDVACDVVTINQNETVYLTGCKVEDSYVLDDTEDGYYHYGKNGVYKSYIPGDEVQYKNQQYYVLKESNTTSNIVTLMKANALTTEEVTTYGSGLSIQITDSNGFGLVKFGPSDSYSSSYVKSIVEAWGTNELDLNDLYADGNGYKVRLVKLEELTREDWASYSAGGRRTSERYTFTNEQPSYILDSRYSYWTMDLRSGKSGYVWYVYTSQNMFNNNASSVSYAIRPVITVSKFKL